MVFSTSSSQPDIVAVAIGAFADPSFPDPRVSVWEDRKHAWIELRGEMEHLD